MMLKTPNPHLHASWREREALREATLAHHDELARKRQEQQDIARPKAKPGCLHCGGGGWYFFMPCFCTK